MSTLLLPDLRVKPIDDKDLKPLERFLFSQDLGYSGYEKWIKKTCLPELYFNQKQGLAVIANNAIIADIIFQQHKQLPETLEIKNLRIDSRYRKRDIAHFLMKQAEVYARQTNQEQIIADFRANKQYSKELLKFILFCGFQVLFKSDSLYNDSQKDYIIGKQLRQAA